MRIEGSIRANLIAAVASARRLRGRPVHGDTVNHWQQLLEHARKAQTQPTGEQFGDVLADLEAELARNKAA